MSNTSVENPTFIDLEHGRGNASVRIYLYGATLTSWKILGQDILFLSEKAILNGAKAIRGGIPLVFPQFGPGKLVQHGFARTSIWKFEGAKEDKNGSGDVSATFSLTSNEETQKVWPFDFMLTYTVLLGSATLECHFEVSNTGVETFEFTTLLHTYFKVDDIKNAYVSGLDNLEYTNEEKKKVTQKGDVLKFDRYIDRIYHGIVKLLAVGDSGNCDITVQAKGFTDMVVWNPWAEKGKAMADMHEDGYKTMVCCEAGQVSTPVLLKSSGKWKGEQILALRFKEQLQNKM